MRHANSKTLYPEKLTLRKLAFMNLEPAEVGELDRGFPPVRVCIVAFLFTFVTFVIFAFK